MLRLLSVEKSLTLHRRLFTLFCSAVTGLYRSLICSCFGTQSNRWISIMTNVWRADQRRPHAIRFCWTPNASRSYGYEMIITPLTDYRTETDGTAKATHFCVHGTKHSLHNPWRSYVKWIQSTSSYHLPLKFIYMWLSQPHLRFSFRPNILHA